ncbi:hypothetical protein HPULCUR_006389 [Helicostylum pulchrum]|uniref:Uncharacterized protein n=1 Tax=Helicostylum pulchrum TaxID=562976 RepID=A0ABP9Y1T7_9FUNG
MSNSNQNNPIILIDSDDETEPIFYSKRAIYIDLSDDEIPPASSSFESSPNTTYDPLTAELEFILDAPISSLLTPTRRNMLPKRDASSVRTTVTNTRSINLSQTVRPVTERPVHRPDRLLSSQETYMRRPSLETPIPRDTNYYTQSSLPRKKPAADSPFNRRPEPKKPKSKKVSRKDRELEDVLEKFVSIVSSTRFGETDSNGEEKAQCAMCRSLFPISLLSSHDQVCYRYKEVRVTHKKTIAEAVAIDENERKRRNIGRKDDVEPTNYYANSDDVFATDGSGFNESASGTMWEYAGQTHFG